MKVRRVATAVATGILCVVIAGCIETDATFDVNEDATVDGEMTVSMSKEFAELMGITDEESFQQQLLDPEMSNLPGGGSVTVREKDGGYEMVVTYDNTPLDDEDLKLELTADDQLKFTYRNEGMGDDDSGMGGMEGMEGSVKFTVRFPGDIVETSPESLPDSVKIDGNILQIDSDLMETIDLTVISDKTGASGGSLTSGNSDDEPITAKTGGSRGIAIGIGIAVVVLALVGVAYMVVRKRSTGLGSDELPPPTLETQGASSDLPGPTTDSQN